MISYYVNIACKSSYWRDQPSSLMLQIIVQMFKTGYKLPE